MSAAGIAADPCLIVETTPNRDGGMLALMQLLSLPEPHMPAGFAKMTKGLASWGWSTVPQKHLNGRVLRYTQAKVLGGGSSINARVYTRGNARDYDAWVANESCAGWSYGEVLPYFRRAEDNQRFSDDYPVKGAVRMPKSGRALRQHQLGEVG